MVFPGQVDELLTFSKELVKAELDKTAAIEIELLLAVKLEQLTIDEIEGRLVRT